MYSIGDKVVVKRTASCEDLYTMIRDTRDRLQGKVAKVRAISCSHYDLGLDFSAVKGLETYDYWVVKMSAVEQFESDEI